jgi:hypothetical protein
MEAAGRSPVSTDVVWALARAGDAGAATALVGLLGDPRPGIRAAAACALGVVGAHDAWPALVNRLDAPAPTESRAAAWALGRLRVRESLPALRAFARSDRDAHGLGAWALGEVGGRESEPELLALVRGLAARKRPGDALRIGLGILALALRAPASRSPFATELKDNPDPFVKDCLGAVRTLQSLAQSPVRVVFPFVLRDRTGIRVRPGEVFRCQPVERWYVRRASGEIVQKSDYLDLLGSKLGPVLFAPGLHRIAHESRPLLVTGACEIHVSPIDRHAHITAASISTDRLSGFALVFLSRAAPAP